MKTTNWKELKKEYLQIIDHDDILVNANFYKGLSEVIKILNLRFERSTTYGINTNDLKALSFILKNESDIRIALS